MHKYLDYMVPIPKIKGKIKKNKYKGDTYIVYTYDKKYNKEKKEYFPVTATIGRVAPHDSSMMYPNENYIRYFFGNTETSDPEDTFRSSRIRIGTFLVIQKIIKDCNLMEHLSSFDEYGTGILLDLAAFSLICESNKSVSYPVYSYDHPALTPRHKIFCQSTISKFLSQIDENDKNAFLVSLNSNRNHKEVLYVTYDVNLYGDNADHGFDMSFDSFALAYDHNNQIPLLYENSSFIKIDTVAQLNDLIEVFHRFQYENISFILDKNATNQEILTYMDTHGLSFLLMENKHTPFMDYMIFRHMDELEQSRSHHVTTDTTCGLTVKMKLFPEDQTDRYIHLYHSTERESAERMQFEGMLKFMESVMQRNIGKAPEFPQACTYYYDLTVKEQKGKKILTGFHLKDDVIEKAQKLFGYHAIITSEQMTAEDAFLLCHNRDFSGIADFHNRDFFDSDNDFYYDPYPTEGKSLIAFLTHIIRCNIYTKLKERSSKMDNRPEYITVPEAIMELENIELYRKPDGSFVLDQKLTTAQKNILAAFGISESDVKTSVLTLGNELMHAAKPEEEPPEDDLCGEVDFDWL